MPKRIFKPMSEKPLIRNKYRKEYSRRYCIDRENSMHVHFNYKVRKMKYEDLEILIKGNWFNLENFRQKMIDIIGEFL